MSNFLFLKSAFPKLAESAMGAEKLVYVHPQAAISSARQALESLLVWMYQYDASLRQPFDASIYNLLNEPTFLKSVPQVVWDKMDALRKVGNMAAHNKQQRSFTEYQAQMTLQELFYVFVWFVKQYGSPTQRPSENLAFDKDKIPRVAVAVDSAREREAQEAAFQQKMADELEKLKKLQDDLTRQSQDLAEREKLLHQLDGELAQARAEVAAAKAANMALPDHQDYHEADTRKYLIDLLLKEAGWEKDRNMRLEVSIDGMPNTRDEGFADYVLYDDNGLPLGVVEAKRTSVSPLNGQQQVKLYADCLERQYGQRPIMFYTNGYETFIWDDMDSSPRKLHGFYTQAELRRLINRRGQTADLQHMPVNSEITSRPYQHEAIRAALQAFADKRRGALLIMATGTGKTRVAVALTDALMKANRVQRVLFLADRTSLVDQAQNKGFKPNLPDVPSVNLVTNKSENARVYLSTYQTMMGLINQMNEDGTRKFGVGMCDVIIVDEAHRSVYQKYGEIFKYFDALLLGLTATPRSEIDRNTFELFGLENGIPTSYYELEAAIKEGYLVPYQAHSVPLKFMREGVKYNDLSLQEQEQWESLDWGDEEMPDEVSASQINKRLFNQDTIDKMLMHLMENGLKVNGGDTLGKTIIFAANQRHAEFIVERFDFHYPHLHGKFARVITHSTKYAQNLIDSFGKKDLPEPQIAVSVDMLDTGIDVPEVLNLVFFKAVRSRVKFDQMIGRGTRLCEHLFAPNVHKTLFYIFDYCGNFEYFDKSPQGTEGKPQFAISHRLFNERLNILHLLQKSPQRQDEAHINLRDELKDGLFTEVRSMEHHNFLVRMELKHVEFFCEPDNWQHLDDEKLGILREHIAKLPNTLKAEHLETKLFDLLCYKMQTALLEGDGGAFGEYLNRIVDIAAKLESKANIPIVAAQIELIGDLQTDHYWEDITCPMIDLIRRKLRDLVPLIEKTAGNVVYTMFDDEIGESVVVPTLSNGMSGAIDVERYKRKVEQFILKNQNHLTIGKLKMGKPLTESDLNELERLVFESQEVGSKEEFIKYLGKEKSLVSFIRSLVGLDAQAVQTAFSKFLQDSRYNETQIRFIRLIIEHLTKNGSLKAEQLYEPPFNGIHYEGVDGVFPNMQDADAIFEILAQFDLTA